MTVEHGLEVTPEVLPAPGQDNPEVAPASTAEANAEVVTPSDEPVTPEAEEKLLKQSEVNELVEKRLAKAARLREKQAAETEYWKQEALRRAASVQPNVPSAEPVEPKQEQFASWEDYNRAVVKHEAAKIARAEIQRMQQESEQRAAQAKAQAAQRQWTAKAEKARDRFDDFDEALGSSEQQYPQPLLDAIAESDIGPELAYHLAKHPEDAERIARLAPHSAIRELGKLEAKLSAPPAVKKVTNAPAPIETVQGRGPQGSKDPGDMTQDEYRKWREGKT